MAEYWDAYLENGLKTNETLIRGKKIADGLFHLVVEILVINNDNEILFMKRHPDKRSYASFFEASAGGSVLKGEESYDAVIRELYEETGIKIDKPVFVDRRVSEKHRIIFDEYIVRLYLNKLPKITLQKGETVDFRWVKKEELYNFYKKNSIIPGHIDKINNFFSCIEKSKNIL